MTDSVHVGGDAYGGVTVTFAIPFSGTPAVLHTLNSYNNTDFMSSVAEAATSASFQVQQEAAETGVVTGTVETIGWIALGTGAGTTYGFVYEVGVANDGATDGGGQTPHTITFTAFTSPPDVVVKGVDGNGIDGFWARGAGVYNASNQTVYSEEDQIGDPERGHADETFGWAAFAANTRFTAACFVEYTGDNVTDFGSNDASAVQWAVDSANPGDTIKVAGTCAGVQVRSGVTQTVYITRDLTLQGGYTITNWSSSNATLYPTILDAQNAGRVVYIPSGYTVNLTNLTLTGGNGVQGGGANSHGGGIYANSNVDLIITSSTITNNTALNGGGIFNNDSLTLTNSTLISNTASTWGGGLYNQSVGTAIFSDSNISGNTANSGGGDFYNNGSLTLTNSTLISNTADTFGGGLYNSVGTAIFSDSNISGNKANSGGGGLYNNGSLTLANSTLISNTAGTFGGGLYNQSAGTAIFSDNTINMNTANSGGGGLFNNGSLTLAGSTLISNTASTFGGGLYNHTVGTAILSDSNINNNNGDTGGGIFNNNTLTLTNSTISGAGLRNGGNASIINSTFSGNRADASGGGFSNVGTLNLIHTTVADNASDASLNGTGDGGGIANQIGYTTTMQNSIIAGNTDGGLFTASSAGCSSGGGTLNDNGYNLIGSGTGCPSDSGTTLSVDATTVFTTVLYELGDYGGDTQTHALLTGSPAIDHIPAGENGCGITVTTDQRGVARPQGDNCDMGAFEARTLALTVTLDGTGSGSVTGSGINCGGDCSKNYLEQTVITLTANPDPGPTFTGWSGDAGGSTNPLTLTIETNKAITATFELLTHTFSLSVDPPWLIEGDSGSQPITFTVERSGYLSITSSVDFAVSGTASFGQRFQQHWRHQRSCRYNRHGQL